MKRTYKKKSTAKTPKRKATPFTTTGRILGRAAGTYFGGPAGGAIGDFGGGMAGQAIGALFGSGKYIGNASTVRINSIINPQKTPTMYSSAASGDSVIVRKCEYLSDIISSPTANTLKFTTFPINPGQSATFPFLSQIAQNYEEYRLKGMVFHFKSLSGDSVASVQSGLGFVAIATQYDALDADFINKSQLENYSMSQSGKPSVDQLHGIECEEHLNALSHLYVRPATQPANSDIRLYDLGKTTIVTSCPGTNVTLGEIWVSYEVELFKPKLNSLNNASTSHVSRNSLASTTTYDFGTTGKQIVGDIAVFSTNNTITWSGLDVTNRYIVQIWWGANNFMTTQGTVTVASGTIFNYFTDTNGTIDTVAVAKSTGTVQNTENSYAAVIQPNAAGIIALSFAGGVIVAGTNYSVDLWLNAINKAVLT